MDETTTKKRRAPGAGRPQLPPEERRTKGNTVTLRLSPLELARLRTIAPPDVGLGTWLRDYLLAAETRLRERAMDTAREFLALVDAGAEWQIAFDDQVPEFDREADDSEAPEFDRPAVDAALDAMRRAVAADDRRQLPDNYTVRLQAGEWSGLLPGLPSLCLPEDMHG